VRHARRETPGGGKIAQSTIGLICEACVEDRLIFRGKRRLLSVSSRFGLVM
jgi:hypothetical protein